MTNQGFHFRTFLPDGTIHTISLTQSLLPFGHARLRRHNDYIEKSLGSNPHNLIRFIGHEPVRAWSFRTEPKGKLSDHLLTNEPLNDGVRAARTEITSLHQCQFVSPFPLFMSFASLRLGASAVNSS